jgi:hypothetical protein
LVFAGALVRVVVVVVVLVGLRPALKTAGLISARAVRAEIDTDSGEKPAAGVGGAGF